MDSSIGLHYFRSITWVIQAFVLPEIKERIKRGEIKRKNLPYRVYSFHAIQKPNGSGGIEPVVQINEEVEFILETKPYNPYKIGQSIGIDDFDPNEVFIKPPEYHGFPATYFLVELLPFSTRFVFDFRPGHARDKAEYEAMGKIRFPVVERERLLETLKTLEISEKLSILMEHNWPPGVSFYPNVYFSLHQNPKLIKQKKLNSIISAQYSKPFWHERFDFWKSAKFFPNRMKYVENAVKQYFRKDYAACIYVLVPQFEGIIRDYLLENGVKPGSSFLDIVPQLRKMMLSREIILFDRKYVDTVFSFLEKGSFWEKTAKINNPKEMINRHGIAHGIFFDFDSKIIALKYLILLESLCYLILHDKIIQNTV
jgi:hypothetical protein